MAVTDSVKIWESVLEACSHTDNVTLYGTLGEYIWRGNHNFDPHMPLGGHRRLIFSLIAAQPVKIIDTRIYFTAPITVLLEKNRTYCFGRSDFESHL